MKYTFHKAFDLLSCRHMLRPLPAAISLLAVLLTCCDRSTPAASSPENAKSNAGAPTGRQEAPTPEPKEPWSALPPEQWPQLVLTNYAEFTGDRKLTGASSFLVKHGDQVLAATAMHLLGENGGVEPPVPATGLNTALSLWAMYPRTKDDQFIKISGLAGNGYANESLDWLLLNLDGEPKTYPSTPLRLRRKPVAVGETVYLVGVSYQEPDRVQGVYTGKVTGRRSDRFCYTIEPPVRIAGFSGAPIVDKDGLAVGFMTVWFEQKEYADGLNRDAGGEDAATALALLK